MRHPGSFGVRRSPRAVSLERPVGSAWLEALLAQAERGDPDTPRQPPGPTVPDWASNAVNSAVGQIAGQPSLGDMQTAFAERAARGVSMTPAAMMQQQRLAGGIDEALDWVRPLALADLGVAGAAGRAMIPIPGGLAPGAAPAAGAARKAGGGIAGALSQLLSRGADEAVSAAAPVVRETTEAARRSYPPGGATWEEFLGEGGQLGVASMKVVRVGQFDVIVKVQDAPTGWKKFDPSLDLSPKGDIKIDWQLAPDASASKPAPGEVRESLRLLGELTESIRDEGFNVWATPLTPRHDRLYQRFGMRPMDSRPAVSGRALVLPGNWGGAG